MNSDWRNPARPLDVNNDMSISPLDALVVINALNARGASSDLGVRQNRLGSYLDTNGDRNLSPLDALLVINELNSSDRSSDHYTQRIDGEAETAPAGFVSIVMGGLAGTRNQIVALSSQLTIGREEFNELGLFVVDGPNGAVNGVLPSSPNYATEVFALANRRVLYSRQSIFRTSSDSTFPAGTTLGVYVLQESSDNGDGDKHLRVRETGTSKIRIGWEEHYSPSPWIGVGDRGYDDVMIDVIIGAPFDGNAEPVIGAIPNQSINEETELSIQTLAMDADRDDTLTFSFDVAPSGTTIDPTTGRFRWTPTEAQGPGNFEVVIRATDSQGAFDTESFFVTVLEVNRPPVLQPIADKQLEVGQTHSFVAAGTDPDLPANSLTYSLLAGAPTGSTIDSRTGAFNWAVPMNTASGRYPITVRVSDGGTPILSDTKSFNIDVGTCAFGANLGGWTIFESGGVGTNKGTATAQSCSAVILEGSSFVVGIEKNVLIPSTPSAIEITYQDLNFDTRSTGFVRDAFEVALVDKNGNSLVQNYLPGRDAFFNSTEGLSTDFRSGITLSNNKISVGLVGLPAGEAAKLIIRLVNNDSDTASSIRIVDFKLIDSSFEAGPPEVSRANLSLLSLARGKREATSIGTVINGPVFALEEHSTEPNPIISVSTSNSHVESGRTVLVSGFAIAQGLRGNGSLNSISHVSVNGRPVDQVDVSGNFFVLISVATGNNDLTFEAFDSAGQSTSVSISLVGYNKSPDSIDFSRLSDNSSSFSSLYFRTSFDELNKLLYTDLATKNNGAISDVPLVVAVKNISDPSVTVVGFDGFTPEGLPYFDYSKFIADGTLSPGEKSESPSISFHNPYRNQFRYDLVFYSQLNTPPEISSIPDIEALTGKQYVYPVTAIDEDNDTLKYRLTEAPTGMIIVEATGKITWTPTAGQVGNHKVVLQVEDGRAGKAIQTYTVSLIVAPPNRPPVIASTPITRVYATVFEESAPITYESDWKYKVVGFGEIPGFESVAFDDSTFPNGRGGFGSGGGCFLNQTARNTTWPTNSDILLRREIDLPIGAQQLKVFGAIDNDIQIFLNGIEISQGMRTSEGCAERNEFSVTAPDSAVRVGKNIVAIRARDRGSESYVDARISVLSPSKGLVATPGIEYRYKYDLNAVDPDDDILAYSVIQGPAGMTIDGSSGQISWTPAIVQIGDHQVKVQASDGRGGVAVQEYTICVEPDPNNNAPVIVSSPIEQSFAGPYLYDVEAVDADSDTLTFSLLQSPSGMTINGTTGLIEWPVPVGTQTIPVRVAVKDGRGGYDEQSFSITVSSSTGTGKIRGCVFDDENGNSQWDVLADSVCEFSSTQGKSNWYYGYYDGTTISDIDPTDFRLMREFDPLYVSPVQELWWASKGQFWTLLSATGAHSNGFRSFTRQQNEQWAVRRWVSEVSGDVLVTGKLAKFPEGDAVGGNGVIARIFLNGVEQWSREIGPLDRTGFEFSLQLDLEVGDAVDFALDTNDGSDQQDATLSTFAIEFTSGKERKLSGRTVYLDQNQNRNRDAGERWALTDANGNYEFSKLPPGTYYVREESFQGWKQTFPPKQGFDDRPASHVVELLNDTVEGGVNFGNTLLDAASNQSPILSNPGSFPVDAGRLFGVGFLATDPENDAITYSLITSPIGMTVHPSLGHLAWQPTPDQIGDHQIVAQVSDGRGGIAIQQFIITVQKPNSSPVFTNSFPTQAVQGRLLGVNLITQDADSDFVAIKLSDGSVGSITESNSTLPNGQAGPNHYRFEWTPTADDLVAGKRSISFEANDGRGGITIRSLEVDIVATTPNQNPSILSKPRTVAYAGFLYAHHVIAEDLDGNPMQYSLTMKPTGMSISAQGLIQWSTGAILAAPQDVEVVVSDGQGGSATQTFQIRVSTQLENTRPTIISNPKLAGREDRLYSYDAVADDAQGDEVVWSLVRGPIGMSIGSSDGRIRWTPRNDQMGSNTVTIRAMDTLGAFSEQSFAIDVACVNTPPLILSAPITQAYVSELYLYGVRGIDPDGDSVQFKTLAAPSGMTISDTGLIRWTPVAADEGQTRRGVVEVSDLDGAKVLQTYDIVVQGSTNRNRPPVITSFPNFSVATGATYSYTVTATDPDSDAIKYFLTTKPTGMSIDEATGVISWTPTAAVIANVVVEARDARGAVATQGFAISVRDNRPPVINSNPAKTVVAGSTYRYAVNATDPDDDSLTYVYLDGGPGSLMDGQGRIVWNVPTDFAKNGPVAVPVSVSVRDSRGAEVKQDYTLTVSADTQAPQVLLQIRVGTSVFTNVAEADLGSTAVVRVFASDNVRVSELTLEVNGQSVALDALGQATIPTTALGNFALKARVKDPSGNVGEATGTLRVRPAGSGINPTLGNPDVPPHPGTNDPTDLLPPTIAILSPVEDETVLNIKSVVATIDDAENNLWFWRVYYGRLDLVSVEGIDPDDPDWIQIGQGTTEVTASEVAKFDPTPLQNDGYAILIAAYDTNGRGYAQPVIVNVEGNAKLGQFSLDLTDLSIPLAGIPIQVTRTFDSRNAGREGDFGFGWTMGVRDARILEAGARGIGGVLSGIEDAFIPDKTKVYLTNPSGQRVGFTYKEEFLNGGDFLGIAGSTFRPYFKADPGVYDTLSIDETTVMRGGVFGSLVSGINPDAYTLTSKDGTAFRYQQSTGLEKVTDRNGQTLSYSSTGITHSSGTSIQFVRDHRGRIKEIVDPDGKKILYEYNAAGNLTKVTSQNGTKSTYSYLTNPAHYLDEGLDDQGKRDFKVTYDAQGRFKEIIDGLGNAVGKQNYDELASRRATVLDANNNATQLLYNDRGNVLEETDPAGNKTIREYSDARNPDLETKIIDRRGMVTDRVYDANGNVTTIKELGPLSSPFATPNITTFSYSSKNNVTGIKNATGIATTFSYDSKGNVVKITNGLGASSTFTYDEQGRRKSFTDFNNNTTTFEYDGGCPCGSPHKSINADLTYQTFEYNQFGQVKLEKSFEANGTLVEQKQTFYDVSGRVTREVIGSGNDPLHSATDVRKFYLGNLLDWEIIVNPQSLNTDGTLKESPSTPVAQRKSRITDYDYDAADRLIKQTDALGGVVNFRYDSQGNRVLLQDPVGNITTWTYDTLNRVSEERDPFYWVSFVNANSTLTSNALLDAVVVENRKPSAASLANNQGAAHVRSFGYDAEGNQSEVIDRNNRRREFSYDQAGRLLTEQWFAANNGPLVETITFTFDVLGNMKTAQNASSKYAYEYDQINRVKSVDNLDSNPDTPRVILNYEYDLQGNLIRTSDNAGVTVQSTYSKRNQLESRKWFDAIVPVGGTKDVADARVDFTYTAAGRQKQILRYSDLSKTTKVGSTDFTYDLSGRTDKLIHKNAVDSLLSSYDYGYDFSGLLVDEKRDHSDNAYDDAITYSYDLTGQLVDAAFTIQDDEHYVYDLNGNRKSSVNGSENRTYTTGPANQLKSDGVYKYEYDGEGNQKLKTRISDGQATENFWDHHNMLVKVEERSAGGIILKNVEYKYDAIGRRTTEIVNVAITLRVVHDGDHTWGDYDATGTADTRYLFTNNIDQIVAAYRVVDGTVWYNADKLGTVRDLSNIRGAIGTQILYSSFGAMEASSALYAWNRFSFTGRESTVFTGVVYYRSRWYASSLGKFITEDSIRFEAGDVNLRRYVLSSPTNGTDPQGTDFISNVLLYTISGAVFGGLGGCLASGSTCTNNDIRDGAIKGFLFGLGTALLIEYVAIDVTLELALGGAIIGGTGGLIVGSIPVPQLARDLVTKRLNEVGLGFVSPDVLKFIVNKILRKVIG